jgi:DNA-directed RNA polymerase specialized sigma24 family protein
MTEGIPQTEAAYLQFRRLLFGALGKLARQGFVVSPVDGVDLVQDFFAEAWSGISSRYGPHKGKLDTYVYQAFVRFARPRIVRLHRWQSYLVDTVEFVRAVEKQSSAEEPSESEFDISAAREALLQLPSFERDVLYSCLLADTQSERKLAGQFSVSRYRLRETLIEALGRVAVLLVVQAGMPYAEQLAWYGVTPLTIFYSTEAVSGVTNRLMRHRVVGPEPVIIGLAKRPEDVPLQQMIVHEMASMAECSELVARALFIWFIDVVRYKPFLFRGFEAQPWADAYSLAPQPNVDNNLYTRWGLLRQ